MGTSGFHLKVAVAGANGQTHTSVPVDVIYDASGGEECPPHDPCECPPGEICEYTAGALAAHAGSAPALPEEFALEKSHPNPVRAGQPVTIPFALPEAAEVTLALYDMLGREVRRIESGTVAAGRPQAVVGTGDLASGVYVYRLRAIGAGSGEPFAGTGKLVIVK